MDAPVKRKVVAKVEQIPPRPHSPTKSYSSSATLLTGESNNFRPKAKVTSSANIVVQKKSSSPYPSVLRRNASPSRAHSPFKPAGTRSGLSSPVAQIKKPNTNTSPISTEAAAVIDELRPLLDQSSLAPNSFSPSNRMRSRHASVSSVSYNSSSSSNVNKLSDCSSSPSNTSSGTENAKPLSLRVKSKVTEQAKLRTEDASNRLVLSNTSRTFDGPMSSTSNLLLSSSSNRSLNTESHPSTLIYPISTTHSAADAHRISPAQISPNSKTHVFYSPSAADDDKRLEADLVSIPSQSPPAPLLSFSSHSSASQPSVSVGNQAHPSLAVNDAGDAVTGLGHLGSQLQINAHSVLDDFNTEEQRDKVEAKTNRKIADLEITNKSLLAINASLEAAKHRQAKEIRDLRRRLRETRLILPSHTFQANQERAGAETNHDNDDEDEDVDSSDCCIESGKDEVYRRVRDLLETLLKTGRQAVESSADDIHGRNGARVLHEVEARSWRVHGRADLEVPSSAPVDGQSLGDEDADVQNMFLSSTTSIVEDSSRDDSAKLAHEQDRAHPTTSPPITITEPI